MMKTIFKAVATVTLFSIITRALGFFFRIFLSRKLGAEGLGLYQMATSVLGIFMTLISSGLPLTTAKMASRHIANGEIKKHNQVVTSSLIIALCLSVLSSIFILVLRSVWGIILTDNRAVEIMIILIPSIIFSAIYAIFRGALWGRSDYFSCGLTELVEQIVRFALTVFMLNSISDFFVATKYSAIAFNIACFASMILTILIYLKQSKLCFSFGEYKNVFKSALPITGVRLANSLVQPLTTMIIPNMLILSGYTAKEAVASFGVIMGMTFPMLFVPMAVIGSISMVLIPTISTMMTKNDYSSIEKNITNSLEVATFISMLFIPLYLSVGDKIGVVLYNNLSSGIMLQISALCVLPITLCNLTGSILNALNLEVKSFVNYLIGSAVLFASLILFTPIVGVNSIVISFFISMGIISILNLKKIKKTIPSLNFNLTRISAKYLMISLPSSLLGNLISKISTHFFTSFFCAVLGGGVAIVSTLILCKILNLYDLSQVRELLKRKRKRFE